MNIINKVAQISSINQEKSDEQTKNYQKDLLNFIKKMQPEGEGEYDSHKLSNLLEIMKERYGKITHGGTPTLSELNSALLSVDGELRKELDGVLSDPGQKKLYDYTHNYLDKYTSQLLNVNMLHSSMMYKSLSTDEDDTIEKW